MEFRKAESLHYSIGLLGISADWPKLTLAPLTIVQFHAHVMIVVPTHNVPVAQLPVLSSTFRNRLCRNPISLSIAVCFIGIWRSLRNATLFSSLFLTISVFWCGYGVVFILDGQGVLNDTGDFRNALVPGLVTFTLALLIIAVVGFLNREVILAVIASAVSLASAHEVAMHYNTAFVSSAVASNYVIVCLAGGYFALGRILYFLTKEKVAIPGTDLAKNKAHEQIQSTSGSMNHFAVTGLILNMLSASVFGCKLLGITSKLFIGQVPWLWAAGIYQIGVCILSYRAMDVLTATFFSFTSILKFAGGYCLLYSIWQTEEPTFPIPFLVVFSILFVVLALFLTLKSLVDGLYLLFYVAYCIALACRPKGFFEGGPQGVDVAIFVASALMTLIHLYNVKAGAKIPTGKGVVKALLANTSFLKLREGANLHTPYLGYSKYADAEVLGYACSVLASFAITVTGDPQTPLATVVIPWVVVAGGILKLLSGSVAFARGKTLESSAFILYAVMWIIWGLTRYGDLYGTSRSFHTAVGIIAFMLFNSFIVFCTLFLNITWFFYSLTFLLIAVSFLLDAIGALPAGYDIAATLIFGLVSFYCFLSALFNSTFEGSCLPMGRPLVQLSGVGGGMTKCLHLPARKASSVKRIAGEWVDFLGMKDSAKYVGTPQSVAIRIPDCSVTTHLIDLVGPIAVTSANPTGEADTTHHNQVYAKLGDKVDAVLCNGPSPENIASTVVDCTKIDSGNIGFFRVGIVPKSQVLQILEQVQKKYSSVPNSNNYTTKGQEGCLNHVHAVHNGVGMAASAAQAADGGHENHTRL
ncbi:UNVERIFIED_CONTAM: hypothetical protein H355_012930 [Colinus virginianus]|nr:hypothetical protein H355_012930 [Colinus virginianus]